MAKKHACACCGEATITEPDFFEICSVCGWEDDGVQKDDPDYRGGANTMSLNEAREAYKKGLPIK